MRKFKVNMENPPHPLFALLDLPMQFDVTEEEFDAIANLEPGEQMLAGEYTFLRIE